jgi:hypothetical protein
MIFVVFAVNVWDEFKAALVRRMPELARLNIHMDYI